MFRSLFLVALLCYYAAGQSNSGDEPVSGQTARPDELLAQGNSLLAKNTPDALRSALADYQQALLGFKQAGDEPKQVDALLAIASAQFLLHDATSCEKSLSDARQLVSAADDKLGQAKVASGYALFYDAQKDEPKAIEEASRSADLFQTSSRPVEESQVLFFLAALFQKTNDQPKLIATYERGLPVAKEAKNAPMEALFSLRLGQFYNLRSGEEAHRHALSLFAQALPYFESTKDGFNQAMVWWGMGTAYDLLSKIEDARNAYANAAALSAALKGDDVRGRLFRSLGADELTLKAWGEAARHLEEAVALLRAPGEEGQRALAAMQLGMAREALKDIPGALDAYRLSANASHEAGDKDMEATAWLKIGALNEKAFEWKQAINASKNAVAVARSGSAMLPAALQSLAAEYLQAGQHKQSLDVGIELLPLLQGVNRVNLLIEMGINCSWLARYSEALKYLNEGLSASPPNTAERAGVLAVLAEVHTSLNKLGDALQEAEESRDIYRAIGQPNGEAKALNQLGLIYQSLGDKSKSEAALNAALRNERANGNTDGQCATLNNLGDLQRYFGDYRLAQPFYREALALAVQIGDRYVEASVSHNLGMAQHGLGEEAEALAALNSSLEIRRQLEDTNDEAKVLASIGLVQLETGEPQKGLDALLKSQELLAKTEDLESEASLLDNLGTAYRALGDYAQAENYFRQAEALSRKASLDGSRKVILNNLATLELSEGLRADASEDNKSKGLANATAWYAEALALTHRMSDKFGEMHVLAAQAVIASEQGDQQRALVLLQRARTLASETGYFEFQGLLEHTIGTVYEKLNDWPAALNHFNLALPVWRKVGRIDGEAGTRFVMAKAECKAGRLDYALRDVQEAIRLSATVRSRVTIDEERASIFATAGSYYQFEIDLLMHLEKLHLGQAYATRAFEASESGRARSLLDLLAESHADLRQGVDPKLLADEKSIERSLAAKEALRRKLAQSPDAAGEEQLTTEIAELSSRYDAVEAEIRQKSPAYAAVTHPQPLSASEIQHTLLDQDTVLLEYSLGQERSYVWALSSDSLHAYELPSRDKIEEQAHRLSTSIRDKDSIDDPAAGLSAILLRPVEKELKRRIIVVADGELQTSVPFAVLPEPDAAGDPEPLLSKHEVLNEPSASALVMLRHKIGDKRSPPKLLALIADPVFSSTDDRLQRPPGATALSRSTAADRSNDALAAAIRSADLDQSGFLQRLKATGTEARTILQLGNPTQDLALIGFDANKEAVFGAPLSDYRVVHFATHGLLNTEHPALSGLALSQYDRQGRAIDGFLTLNDVYNMRVPVNLVVLSACESGQGRLVQGEGIVGLTRGFLYAGARSVIVSLWNVNDQSTAELMRRFYQSYFADKMLRPAAALRTAQLSMMRGQQWSHPYYWAAFSVQGDWQ